MYVFNKNYNTNLYDEADYLLVSDTIIKNGLLNLNEPLRIYLYPFIIGIVRFVIGDKAEIIKVIISILQFILYSYTIFNISNYCKNFF